MTDILNHKFWLTYHSDNPGILLMCSCGWKFNLGWLATPADAWFREQEHRREEESKIPDPTINHPKEPDGLRDPALE